jgi:acetylornithine deacetylase
MEILKKLIQTKSVSNEEGGIQKYILNLLTSYKLKPFYIKGNVAVHIEGQNSKKCLIFNAHVDTVSPGKIEKWKQPPYSAYKKSGKIYGLGASDEKAAVAVELLLAKYYSHNKPECDIWLTFVVGEEIDGHGSKDFLIWFNKKYLKLYKNISAILGEPTGLNEISLAHKGNLFLKITTFGKSGHGSEQHKDKDHAVLTMLDVILSLNNLGKTWKTIYKDKILGFPTIAPATSIIAGEVNIPNKYPDSCIATFDIRTVPAMHNRAYSEIKKAVKGKKVKVEFLYSPVGCGYTDKNSTVAKLLKNLTNKPFSVSKGSTDMYFFTQKGIPAVIFGPGEKGVMHKANEYCYSKKIGKCVEIFLEVIKGYNNFND